MKTVIIIDNDFIFYPQFMIEFAKKNDSRIPDYLIGIVMSPIPSKSILKKMNYFKKKVIFLGGLPGVFKITGILTMKMINSLRYNSDIPFSLEEACRQTGLNYFLTNNVNDNNTEIRIKNFKPDLIISMQSQIIKKNILQIPSIGIINKHAGLLPKYRGIWPIFWTLLYGERECGVTLHWVNEKIDDGDIVYQYKFAVNHEDTVFSLYNKIYQQMPRILTIVLNKIESGTIQDTENKRSEATYFGFPSWKDIHLFKNKKQYRII